VRQAETLAHGERNWEIIIGLVIRAYYACPPVDEASAEFGSDARTVGSWQAR
jgi:hypothetical protein